MLTLFYGNVCKMQNKISRGKTVPARKRKIRPGRKYLYDIPSKKKGHREKNIFVVSCYPNKKATRFNQQSNQCSFLFFRTSKLISCQLLKILETNDWLQNFNNRIHSGGRVANDTRAPIQHSNWRFIDLNTVIQGQDPPVGDCVDISIS